jgi:hypothetical protein
MTTAASVAACPFETSVARETFRKAMRQWRSNKYSFLWKNGHADVYQNKKYNNRLPSNLWRPKPKHKGRKFRVSHWRFKSL